MKKWLIPTICFAALCILGCESLINRITPSDIPPCAVEYVGAEPNEFWPTLHSAKELRMGIIVKHRTEQLSLRRLAEDDKYAFDDALSVIDPAIEESIQLQAQMIGTEAQPGLLWSLFLGGGSLYAGARFIKRPEEKELEKKINGRD